MMQFIKRCYGAVSLMVLSAYCGGVLALQGAVDKTIPAASTAATNPPNVPTVPDSGASHQQILVGSLGMFGRLFVMIAVVWLIVVVILRLAGKKPSFSKPIIFGLIGIVLVYLPRAMVK